MKFKIYNQIDKQNKKQRELLLKRSHLCVCLVIDDNDFLLLLIEQNGAFTENQKF